MEEEEPDYVTVEDFERKFGRDFLPHVLVLERGYPRAFSFSVRRDGKRLVLATKIEDAALASTLRKQFLAIFEACSSVMALTFQDDCLFFTFKV